MTYGVSWRLGWEEEKRADDVACCIRHEHHSRRNTLLGEAGNIGSHHRERYGKASCESHKDPETEQLASLVGSVTNKEGASKTATIN